MEVHEAASRLLACPRLSREREAERQRAIQQPLAVNWREKIEANGQKHQRQVATKENVVWQQHHVAGVRKRRLGEEDAAFLLFYGDRETPSANILRLIIELISTDTGESDEFLSRCVKYLLWRKLSTAVEAGLANERLVQSEWTKIVFSCPVPAHRRRSGPMPRPDLLPRPITITVRPLQLARRRPQRRNLCVASASTAEVATKQEPASPRVTPEERAVALANRLAGKGARSKAKSPKKSTKTTQTKSPRGEVRKRPSAATYSDTSNGYAQLAGFSPRKHRRRNGEVGLPTVTPRQVVRAKSPSGQSISQKLMEPLPYDCRTLGDNRSLPLGWRPPGQGSRTMDPVEVNPMLQMTADEIVQHIASVRREGRFTSFEKVTDILLKLMADPRNRHGVFNTPVDPIALELPAYTTIVQHPMDLGTVKRNLAAGEYLELEDFVSDVRLVFENAMVFNPESHYIHVDAGILLNRFNEAVKAEQNRQAKRQRVQHVCLVCRGNTCIVCNQQCLDVTPPHLQCSAGCSTEIRKGSIYFISEDGTRVWCQKCKTRLARDRNAADRAPDVDTDAMLDALIKKKCEAGVEPWVKCGECDRWLHQVCGLYNPVIGAYEVQKAPNTGPDGLSIETNPYVCPLCRCRRKRATPPPESPMRKILNVDPDEHAQNSSCLNIPSCELSIFIQNFLRRGLNEIGELEAAQTLYVRALSFPGEHLTVPEGVVRVFDENAQLLAQMRPGTNTNSQRLPARISYLSRGLYLFQKHEGMEVCLFTIYAQEFGDDCELEANRRAVYIAYLDSVRYLKPTSARTAAYHLILLAYFDYVRRHGFSRVHIWSCPPQKRISYVFWCRPAFQKTPSAEHLRRWYSNLLTKAKEYGIVKDWTTLYDRYFSDSVCGSQSNGESTPSSSFVSVKEESGVGVSTRGTTVLSVNPDELVWPANHLPPIFDGDIVPSELERILGRIISRNEKQKRASENKKLATRGKNSSMARAGGKLSFGGVITRIKEEVTTDSPPPAPQSLQVDVKVREVFTKCQFAVQRLKNDLLVVDLETLVPSWFEQVPRFFSSRFMFHQLCSLAGYQFDSLRRAKHSTMMMVHHYFNEQVGQLNVFCRECSLLITRADVWSCRTCVRFALCDTCFRRQGSEHPHQLFFGSAALTVPPRVQRMSEPQQHVEPQTSVQLPPTVNVCERVERTNPIP
ncbi:histone acetyltransferase, putative [Phytophthora infestans T30-4]|uniref:histone acetyltransferase n=1 Tax=Phytophthora infestans (strain T30-4) TaxID=403677 RepID=D0NAZ6_PHYIT|nr:histone acetyltransferase, putative [Phytophthora infestans T30-4]EEY55004.1 histone acetyltransferase, putative [Phytophthora infestans T30-4]|eukprot:XP_002903949.1 histone acetyltransferase, putative [Phytophthora infestans T30-4]